MPTTNELTDQQARVLQLLQDHERRMVDLTIREIGQHFGFTSPNGVLCHLEALERKGYIRRHPERSRGIEIIREENRDVTREFEAVKEAESLPSF